MSELHRVLIFGSIGVLNSLIDIAIFWVLIKTLGKKWKQKKGKLSPATAFHTLSFLAANVNSFFLNSVLTFADSKKENPSWLSFFLVSLISLVLSASFIQFFSGEKYFQTFQKLSSKFLPPKLTTNQIWYLVLKLIAIILVMTVNYFGYKIFVF